LSSTLFGLSLTWVNPDLIKCRQAGLVNCDRGSRALTLIEWFNTFCRYPLMNQRATHKRFTITKLLNLFCTIVGAIALYIGVRDYLWSKNSVDWPHVKGEILSSYVKWDSASSDNGYRAIVEYDYSVNGQHYLGDKISFTYDGHATTHTAKMYVNQYSEGSTVKIYYSPKRPSVSVLEPGLRGDYWLVPAVGGSMFIVGLWGFRKYNSDAS